MNSSEYDDLLRARLLGPLSSPQRERLQTLFGANPELRAKWADDIAVHVLIHRLPDAPLASNFTSQVLRQVENSPRQPVRWSFPWPTEWVRPLAYASLALAIGSGTIFLQRNSQRAELAKSAATVATVAQLVQPARATAVSIEFPPMPPTEIWANFDAIHRLPEEVDMDLLLALE